MANRLRASLGDSIFIAGARKLQHILLSIIGDNTIITIPREYGVVLELALISYENPP